MNVAAGTGSDISGGGLSTALEPALGQNVVALSFPSSTNQSFAESTLLRIRGSVVVPKSESDGLTVPGFTTVYSFGIGIISEKASEVLTAIPNPATAAGYDWDGWLFLRTNWSQPVDPAGEIVDVKAMRKWRSGDSIVFVCGVSTDKAAGALIGVFTWSLRGLFLLP